MKKDIEWLKKEIATEMIELEPNRKERWSDVRYHALRSVAQKIYQLDEPEVLSEDWINKHKYRYDNIEVVGIKDLQNLLVPKQEELESKIKVLIEAYKQEDGAYSNPENGWISGFVEDLENLVEEEQKYYVLLGNQPHDDNWTYALTNLGSIEVFEKDVLPEWDRTKLTEQEIKDYDERYMAFAIPVEELEE